MKQETIIISVARLKPEFSISTFGSLAAIYSTFTPEEIGCTLRDLYDRNIGVGEAFNTGKVIISKTRLYRMAHHK